MSKINDTSVVKQQYATANNLNRRISIHDKYSTNKMGFGNWIISNYRIDKGMKVLELGCGTGDMWKNRESLISDCSKLILSDFSEGMVATTKENVDDKVDYIYSLSSMTSLNNVPKHIIKEILMQNLTNGILNVPKEYGMFIAS